MRTDDLEMHMCMFQAGEGGRHAVCGDLPWGRLGDRVPGPHRTLLPAHHTYRYWQGTQSNDFSMILLNRFYLFDI